MALKILPDPVLIVTQSTGSGKSFASLTSCGIVDGGVSIGIEKILAISSDQASKVNSQTSIDDKFVCVYFSLASLTILVINCHYHHLHYVTVNQTATLQ